MKKLLILLLLTATLGLTLVDEMLEKYGLEATLMLYKNASNDLTKIATLNELFADGRLAPESHSSTHTQISSNANNTPRNNSEGDR